MPDKIGEPKPKTPKEIADDKKLLQEIEEDPQNPGQEFDPLEAQAERLPASIKGSDGDKAHVLPVGEDGSAVEPVAEEIDEDLGGGVGDGSDLTAD